MFNRGAEGEEVVVDMLVRWWSWTREEEEEE